MSLASAMIVLVLLALVVLVVGAPLRGARGAQRAVGDQPGNRDELPASARASDAQLRELEAAREAKYREIRDAEMDFRTGKLSREDFETIDAELRTDAIAILDRLEAAGERGSTP